MPHENELTSPRRLTTPDRIEAISSRESVRRSRSRTRQGSHIYRSRSGRRRTPSRDIGRAEQEVERQREKLRALEDVLRRERSRSQQGMVMRKSRERGDHRQSRSDRDRSAVRTHRNMQCEHNCSTRRDRSRSMHRARSRSAYRERSHVARHEQFEERPNNPRNERRSERSPLASRTLGRSDSPTFTSKDIVNIINSLTKLKSQNHPSTLVTALNSNSNMNHKNILPDFDPSSKSHRIDIWIKKVNECATVYGWDEKTIIHAETPGIGQTLVRKSELDTVHLGRMAAETVGCLSF